MSKGPQPENMKGQTLQVGDEGADVAAGPSASKVLRPGPTLQRAAPPQTPLPSGLDGPTWRMTRSKAPFRAKPTKGIQAIQDDSVKPCSDTAAYTVCDDFPAHNPGGYSKTSDSQLAGHAGKPMDWPLEVSARVCC